MDEQQEAAFQQMKTWSTRPTGSTRRSMRMQQDWDKRQEMMMEEQKMAADMERQSKQMEALDLDMRLKERELSVAREEDIFNKSQQERTLAEQEQAFKYINAVRGQPNAYEAASEALSGLPFAAASEPVQKALWALGQARDLVGAAKMAEEQKELAGEVREARQLGLTDKDLATTQDINPETGEVFTDRGRLQKLIDETKGKRTLKKEGIEEEKDEYRPMSVEQAKDQFDIAKAEFDSVSGSFEEDDEEYKKADARLRRAEAQLRVSEGRTKGAPKKETGYEVGKSYSGMIYTGGDPNSESSWKKK